MRTPKYPRSERNKWYAQVEIKKRSVKEVCQIFGISRQCYYEWHQKDRSLRRKYRTDLPIKNQPNTKLTLEVKDFIYKNKILIQTNNLQINQLFSFKNKKIDKSLIVVADINKFYEETKKI